MLYDRNVLTWLDNPLMRAAGFSGLRRSRHTDYVPPLLRVRSTRSVDRVLVRTREPTTTEDRLRVKRVSEDDADAPRRARAGIVEFGPMELWEADSRLQAERPASPRGQAEQ